MRTTARRVISSVLALMLLSTAGLSQVLSPRRVARSVPAAPLSSQELEWQAPANRGEPIELSVREDVRELCRRFALPPEPYVFETAAGSEADARALAGLAACFQRGPLAGRGLELIGPTALPGRREHASEAAAPADAARSLLNRLGVPFERLVTYDVPLDPFTGEHAAPRVVIAPAAPDAR